LLCHLSYSALLLDHSTPAPMRNRTADLLLTMEVLESRQNLVDVELNATHSA